MECFNEEAFVLNWSGKGKKRKEKTSKVIWIVSGSKWSFFVVIVWRQKHDLNAKIKRDFELWSRGDSITLKWAAEMLQVSGISTFNFLRFFEQEEEEEEKSKVWLELGWTSERVKVVAEGDFEWQCTD